MDYAASRALAAYYIVGNVTLSNLRICYAQTAVYLNGGARYYPNSISNCRVESSQEGVHPAMGGNELSIANSTAIDVTTPVAWETQGDPPVSGNFTNKQSLSNVMSSATLALSVAHQPDYSLETWRLFNVDGNGFPISYNPSCWIYGLQRYTSLSPSNGLNVNFTQNDWWDPSCTLITPRHPLLSAHKLGPGRIGRSFRFIGTDGTHHVRQCQAYRLICEYRE